MALTSEHPTARSRLPPRILVIDDNPMIGTIVRRMLERWGYGVAVVESGREALEHVRTWPPDLALVDLNLRDMYGGDLVRQIHAELGADAPAMIILTGEDDAAVDGTVAVCQKSAGMNALVPLVQAHTRRRRRGRLR
jgi:CheY-like chemotaxis protein